MAQAPPTSYLRGMASETKRKILVVDDSVDFTRLVKLSLEATGEFDVQIESDPLSALGAVKASHPDVILLDYIMPEMNGGDFADQLKDDPELMQIPIVFLTGSDELEAMGDDSAFSRHHCLLKPAAVDDIIDAIEEAMGTSQA
jgi:CheY-like chemotaxis protein